MKNRPRLLNKLVRDSAVLIAKGLYREPQYNVSTNGNTIYVDKISKDYDDCILTIYVNTNTYR